MLDASARALKALELNQRLAQIRLQDKKEFGKRLDQAECTCGSMKQNINIPLDHGVYFEDDDHPLVNANDHVRDKHLCQFGRCTSDANPKNKASELLTAAFPVLNIVKYAKKAMGSEGCKCRPMTLTSWKDGDDINRLDGAPAILDYSQCLCVYGGVIAINREQANPDPNATNDETEEETNILDTIPPDIAKKINAANEANAMAADASEFSAANPDAAAAVACSATTSAQNAMNNASQVPGSGCMNEGGYLTGTVGLGNYNIASSNAASMGSCAVGCHNAFAALGEPVSFADTISLVESCQFQPGMVAIGPTLLNMCTMHACMQKCGFESNFMSSEALLGSYDTMADGDVAVLGVSNMRLADGQLEFCTMVKGENGLTCMEMPSVSCEEMLQNTDNNHSMVLGVSKRSNAGMVKRDHAAASTQLTGRSEGLKTAKIQGTTKSSFDKI